jgi:hypothetical protein
MRLRIVLAVAAALLPLAGRAQPIEGLYIGAGAGVNFLEREYTVPSAGLGTPRLKAVFNSGFAGLGSIGYALGNGWRFEVEGSFRSNPLHSLNGTPYPTTAGGWQQNYGVMTNALFDLDIGLPWLFPYMGGGIGYQWTRWRGIRATDTAGFDVINASGTSGNFAYQAIGGLSFPIPHVPGLSVTAEYRFMGVLGQQSFNGVSEGFVSGGGRGSGNLNIKTDFNNSVLLGLRYAFFVPPPPAPPVAAAPAPAPTRSYLVFFDWDKYNLTDRAKQIIADAAANIPKVQHTRIEVNGYTDTSGTPKYNMGLSIRRANAVAAELVRLGVKKEEIAIQGFGETHLLVPTGPGVREAQNRRVEIIIK